MNNIIVADLMTRNPFSVKPNMNLLECAKIMITRNVGSLLIVDNKRLVGFISQGDILWALTKTSSKEDLAKINVIDISPKKIATIKPTATIREAINKMNHFKFERLPVIHNGELVGMITIKDILNFQPEIYPEIEEFSQIREETEKLNRLKQARAKRTRMQGICEECGATDWLYRSNGMLICESCRNET